MVDIGNRVDIGDPVDIGDRVDIGYRMNIGANLLTKSKCRVVAELHVSTVVVGLLFSSVHCAVSIPSVSLLYCRRLSFPAVDLYRFFIMD